MKKAFLAIVLCLTYISTFSQVNITPSKSSYEFPINSYTAFMHNLEDDTFVLSIPSDNQFETTRVHISLGDRAQALKSIDGLLAAIDKGQEFKVEGYECYVYSRCIFFHNIGKLQYTAGVYSLSPINLKKCRKWLQKNQ